MKTWIELYPQLHHIFLMKKPVLSRSEKSGRIAGSKIVGFGALRGTVKVKRVDITKPVLSQAVSVRSAAKK